jgi:transposase
MNRLKALYRGWGIPCAGTQVYAPRYREEWLSKIVQAGVRRRAELLYQQLDGLQGLRRNLRPEFVAESRKHKAAKLLRQIPCIGPIRAARLIALMQTRAGSAASGNSGPIVAWGLRPTTARNSALSVDNCNVPRNPSSSVVSIEITTMR